jgi:hypothetical protein
MTADDVLMSSAELSPHEPEVRRRAAMLDPPLNVDLEDPIYGAAFTRYLLFEHWPDLLGRDLPMDQIFYNRYFWLVRAATLYQERHGPDAGLEQMAFQLIEHAEGDIDFDLLQTLEARAREGREL